MNGNHLLEICFFFIFFRKFRNEEEKKPTICANTQSTTENQPETTIDFNVFFSVFITQLQDYNSILQ